MNYLIVLFSFVYLPCLSFSSNSDFNKPHSIHLPRKTIHSRSIHKTHSPIDYFEQLGPVYDDQLDTLYRIKHEDNNSVFNNQKLHRLKDADSLEHNFSTHKSRRSKDHKTNTNLESKTAQIGVNTTTNLTRRTDDSKSDKNLTETDTIAARTVSTDNLQAEMNTTHDKTMDSVVNRNAPNELLLPKDTLAIDLLADKTKSLSDSSRRFLPNTDSTNYKIDIEVKLPLKTPTKTWHDNILSDLNSNQFNRRFDQPSTYLSPQLQYDSPLKCAKPDDPYKNIGDKDLRFINAVVGADNYKDPTMWNFDIARHIHNPSAKSLSDITTKYQVYKLPGDQLPTIVRNIQPDNLYPSTFAENNQQYTPPFTNYPNYYQNSYNNPSYNRPEYSYPNLYNTKLTDQIYSKQNNPQTFLSSDNTQWNNGFRRRRTNIERPDENFLDTFLKSIK